MLEMFSRHAQGREGKGREGKTRTWIACREKEVPSQCNLPPKNFLAWSPTLDWDPIGPDVVLCKHSELN